MSKGLWCVEPGVLCDRGWFWKRLSLGRPWAGGGLPRTVTQWRSSSELHAVSCLGARWVASYGSGPEVLE